MTGGQGQDSGVMARVHKGCHHIASDDEKTSDTTDLATTDIYVEVITHLDGRTPSKGES